MFNLPGMFRELIYLIINDTSIFAASEQTKYPAVGLYRRCVLFDIAEKNVQNIIKLFKNHLIEITLQWFKFLIGTKI